jgi:hypothetical protein
MYEDLTLNLTKIEKCQKSIKKTNYKISCMCTFLEVRTDVQEYYAGIHIVRKNA